MDVRHAHLLHMSSVHVLYLNRLLYSPAYKPVEEVRRKQNVLDSNRMSLKLVVNVIETTDYI